MIFSLDNDDLSISRLREDDIIILYPYDENKNSPLSQQLLKGYIIDINESKVKLSLANKFIPKKYLKPNLNG